MDLYPAPDDSKIKSHVETYRELLKINPENPDIPVFFYRKLISKIRQGQHNRAVDIIRQWIDLTEKPISLRSGL